MCLHRLEVHARVAGGGALDEVVERHQVGARQRQQQLQRRLAGAGLQPGQGARRDAGRLGHLGQGQLALAAQRPEPGADGGQCGSRPCPQFATTARKVAERCGAPHARPMTENTGELDVLVVGGGAAGLSAGSPWPGPAAGSSSSTRATRATHRPATSTTTSATRASRRWSCSRRGRAELASYGGSVREAGVVDVRGARGDFTATLDDGSTVHARRLVVTTGLVDRLPDIEGIAERWGTDVLHCPYCHGWEVRDQVIGVLAGPFMPTHQAQLFRQLSEDVTRVPAGPAADRRGAGRARGPRHPHRRGEAGLAGGPGRPAHRARCSPTGPWCRSRRSWCRPGWRPAAASRPGWGPR